MNVFHNIVKLSIIYSRLQSGIVGQSGLAGDHSPSLQKTLAIPEPSGNWCCSKHVIVQLL